MKYKISLIINLAVLLLLGAPVCGQQSPLACIANIQKRLDDLGPQTDFDFLEARKILRDFDFGKVSEIINDPAKEIAFKKYWHSLSEFTVLCGNNLSAKGMRGYSRLSGGIIRPTGSDFIPDLKIVFGGANFDAHGFNEVMEHLTDNGVWLAQGKWKSPNGLIYGNGSAEGHRISHIMAHSIEKPTKSSHGVWNLSRKDILLVIDEGWKNKPTVQDVTQGNRRLIIKNYGSQVGRYDSGNMGGNTSPASMTHIAYIIENNNEIVSSFPVTNTFRFP